jgi:hypothetical protein
LLRHEVRRHPDLEELLAVLAVGCWHGVLLRGGVLGMSSVASVAVQGRSNV